MPAKKTPAKKSPSKKLTVKNLENLKGGVVTVEATISREDDKTNTKTTDAGQKSANSVASASRMSFGSAAIS